MKCRYCDNYLRPKPLPRGGVEAPSQFKARRFCSRHCWREWKRESAYKTGIDKLAQQQRESIGKRRFVTGQMVWYTRSFTESFGWPVKLPAQLVRYLDDYGRSRVVIVVLDRHGKEHAVWTTERKLSERDERLPFEDERIEAEIVAFERAGKKWLKRRAS